MAYQKSSNPDMCPDGWTQEYWAAWQETMKRPAPEYVPSSDAIIMQEGVKAMGQSKLAYKRLMLILDKY
jgi:tRNA U34 5-methylaminomethyl-2-thiouridine-forming methyltransferase MnmC